ncbi:MAG: hypothetical protein ACXVRP_06225 [Solirubrobacteraceae bacterium]
MVLGRELLGYQHSRAQFASWLEPPRPQLTLMIDLDGGLTASGERLPDAWIGGLDDRPTIVGFGAAYASIDLKLTPLGAYTLTGLPLTELTGACVSLQDVFGHEAAELAVRVRELEDWDARFDLLEAFLLARVADGPRPDPAVAWAWQRLCASRGAVRVEALARELGCSRRYLSDGFRRQVGLPPRRWRASCASRRCASASSMRRAAGARWPTRPDTPTSPTSTASSEIWPASRRPISSGGSSPRAALSATPPINPRRRMRRGLASHA